MQRGIQTGHAAVDIVRKYVLDEFGIMSENEAMVKDWADNHKTFIVLNGGNNASLMNTYDIISKSNYPFIKFHEDEDSLGSILTCVGVVIPETIFDTVISRDILGEEYIMCEDEPLQLSKFDPTTEKGRRGIDKFNFIRLIKTSRLA